MARFGMRDNPDWARPNFAKASGAHSGIYSARLLDVE